jgi:hypothetical protein
MADQDDNNRNKSNETSGDNKAQHRSDDADLNLNDDNSTDADESDESM